MSKPQSIVILTGAGISAESGLKTFRGEDGLWEGHPIEEVASPIGWKRDPQNVWRFYQLRRNQLLEVEPNDAHGAIAKLQQSHPNVTLITQNVDDLHERGGSNDVVHMHGELKSLRCELSNRSEYRMNPDDLSLEFLNCNCCAQPSRLRPDIVWFGEIPMHMQRIYQAVENCDLFITIGSSGVVYPAAGLARLAKECGAKTILMNLEESENLVDFDEVIFGPAGEIVPNWVDDSLSLWGFA